MLSQTRPKTVSRFALIIVVAVLAIAFTPPIVQADTQVGGPIISDTTWTATNSPYIVVESVEVWEDVTLTVESGVTVKFDAGKKLQVSGELIAQGTEANPITFTSNRADPAPGDWDNIEFTNTAITTTMDSEGNYVTGSLLRYCVVEYAGNDADSAIDGSSLLIDQCIVRYNDARGIYDPGTDLAPSRVTNSEVKHNSAREAKGGGIYLSHGTVSGNTVTYNSVSGSKYDGGGIYASASAVTSNTVAYNSTVSGGYRSYSAGGGIYASESTVRANHVIANSVESSGSWECVAQGGGIKAYSSTITGNRVAANSVSAFKAGQGGGIWSWSSTVSGNFVFNNDVSGRYGRGGGIYAEYSSVVTGNTVRRNVASAYYYPEVDLYSGNGFGGGIHARGSTVSNNAVTENWASAGPSNAGYGGGIWANQSLVNGNVIAENVAGRGEESRGGGVHLESGTALSNTITGNNLFGNEAQGLAVYVSDYADRSPEFCGNTVVNNSGDLGHPVGAVEIDGTAQIHENNLYGNEPYDVVIASSGDISGTYNYWGPVSDVDILAQIYDWRDDSSRGKLLYVPYLQEPSSNAPLPPPTGLVSEADGETVVLSWDPHPSFTTGYGYKVYYDSDAFNPPYEGTGLDEGDAPIDVGDQTTYTLTGLDLGKDYYFAVTAYDNEGHESWYSNVESERVRRWVYLPLVLKE